ncbi:MAG: flagellar hook capping FlgD N-terminal domain-containing protein [Steroidobacteraceae bacterium]
MSTTNAVGNSASSTATSAATAAAAGSSSGSSASSLGINDFLTLMSTQLQNQDPFKPLDGTQFVAQLAQFGTVSSLKSMQDSLSTLTDSLRSSQALSGASLVGHQVLTNADSSNYTAGSTLSGAVDVPAGAQNVKVTITDASGAVVREMSVSNTEGTQSFSWDGATTGGTAAPSGSYKVGVSATVGGQSQKLQPQLIGTVGSISIDSSGGVTVNTPELGSVALNDVQQIA